MSVKILRIIARLNIGGPARNAVLLTEGLSNVFVPRETGNTSRIYETVLICGEVGSHEGDMMYLAKEKGIEPILIEELGRDLSIRNDWRAFWRIYKIICREKPDIIHTHTAKAGTLGRLAGILYNITHFGFKLRPDRCKLIHTFHGHVLHSYFGRVKTWFFIWIERFLALFTDRIITVSLSLKRELVEGFRIATERKISVIELGFELDDLFGLSVKEKSDCLTIGIIGRLVPVKGHRMFFRVVKKVKDRGLRVQFSVIGDGELRQELENYAKELGIADIVEFKGWVKDLREIYSGLDIVVLMSLNEGTPVSIIEAMAAARPVVATEVGGVSDIVQDGKNGYLIRDKGDDCFAERLLDLINNCEKRKRFGLYGRELATKRFSKERLIGDIETLYRTILRTA